MSLLLYVTLMLIFSLAKASEIAAKTKAQQGRR